MTSLDTRAVPPLARGLSDLAGRYDVLVVDLWGTAHNGLAPFPGVPDALARARAAGLRVVMVTNAPRRSAAVVEQLAELGLDAAHHDAVVTAGEVAWRALRDRRDPWHAALGTRGYLIGPAWNRSLLEGNGVTPVETVAEAEFVVLAGPTGWDKSVDDHVPILAECRARGLKLICANPDLEVIRGDQRLVCAGAIAMRYEAMGGAVQQHGKPYRGIYDLALEIAGNPPRERVLAIGDGLPTDIAGALGAGLDCAFIPGGLHGEAMGIAMGGVPDAAAYAAVVAPSGLRPTWLLPALAW